MKKAMSLILVICMAVSLCAFGAGVTYADDEKAAEVEPVKLVMSTSKIQTESGGIFLDYFCDYAEEASGGAITFDRYYGGTLASSNEELSMLESGAISVAAIMGNQFGDALPLLQFPDVGFESNEKTTEYFRGMLLENEATASLLAEEAAASNVKYLGIFTGGTRVWFSKSPIATLADGQGKVFGGMAGLALMADLGFNTVPTPPPDCYESLSRGIVDLCGLNLIAACDMMWYEVAPNVTIYGAYGCGSPLVINLDIWNSLSEAQQAILQEAADAACEFSLEYVLENEGEYRDKLEGEWGATVYDFGEEDAATYREKAVYIGCLDAYTRCNTPEMQTILEAVAEYWETDISDIFA